MQKSDLKNQSIEDLQDKLTEFQDALTALNEAFVGVVTYPDWIKELDEKAKKDEEPHSMWLNAFQCIRPTEEFATKVGMQVIKNVMEARTEEGYVYTVRIRAS